MFANKPTVLDEIHASIRRTELFSAMKHCGRYEDDQDIIDTILQMRQDVREGNNPDDILHEEGFEPDYLLDLI